MSGSTSAAAPARSVPPMPPRIIREVRTEVRIVAVPSRVLRRPRHRFPLPPDDGARLDLG